jgi:hypothetical protein
VQRGDNDDGVELVRVVCVVLCCVGRYDERIEREKKDGSRGKVMAIV